MAKPSIWFTLFSRRTRRRLRRSAAFALRTLSLQQLERSTSHVAWLLVGGLIFMLLNYQDFSPVAIPTGILFLCLGAIAAFDACYYIIPNLYVLILGLSGLFVIHYDTDMIFDRCAAGATGFLSIVLLEASYKLFRGQPGIGRGDAKLLAAGGIWVGLEGLPSVVFWAAMSGLTSVALMRLQHDRIVKTTAIAFGPHLAAAIWLVWLVGPLSLS